VTSWHYVVNSKGNDTINDLEVVHFAGAEHIIERLDHIQCKIGPKSFFQTNSRQTKVLYKTAVDFAELDGSEVVYDLYTGTGTIALFAAKNCERVIGIEQISEAIDDAKSNSLINNINNCEFLVGDVKDLLNPDFAAKFGKADVIITDPPRAGMHKDVVETLLHLSPVKIVYISCNPSTQARDIGILKEKYELVKCRPIDMFPHTSHIENVALLQFK
jgi:23S rRNA (uracil1939-C5)-methyltransferase